jgi:hypothetical protein
MYTIISGIKGPASGLFLIFLIACTGNPVPKHNSFPDGQTAFNYLKELEGQWVVQGAEEGVFGWEFDLTSRGGVIVERLKVGMPTEMTTVYHLDNGILVGNHYCQLQNQPNLTAVTSEAEGDLHFLCNGQVGNTQSHDELHMHGVHFRKKGNKMLIWMDMLENGEIAFKTSYELTRANSESKQENSR